MTPALLKHILVVDDNADDRAELRSQLLRGSDQRWRFTEAATGRAALQALKDIAPASFDCVLLDFYLPDMDAQEVLHALCAPSGHTPCPVLVVTGGLAQDGQRLMRAGAQDYIGKAWTTPQSLSRAVDNAMERFAMQQEGLRCQQALAVERERLTLALAAGSMGVFELRLDNGSLYWSPEVYALMGVPPAVFEPSRASFRMLVHPEDRSLPWRSLHEGPPSASPQTEDGTEQAHTTGGTSALHSLPSLPVTQEFRILRPDGQCRWMAQRGQTDTDAATGVLRHHGVIFDITERKRAEAEQLRVNQSLREQQFYTRSLIEANVDALVVTNAQGTVTDSNQQMELLTGCTQAELLGSNFTDLFVDPGLAQHTLDQTLSSQHLFDHELELRGPGDSHPMVSLNASTFHDRQRKLLGVIFSARDVTQRHFLNHALLETNVFLEEARFLTAQDQQARSEQTRQNNRELLKQLQAVLQCVEQLEAGPPPPSPVQAVSIAMLLQDSRQLLAQIQATVAAPADAADSVPPR